MKYFKLFDSYKIKYTLYDITNGYTNIDIDKAFSIISDIPELKDDYGYINDVYINNKFQRRAEELAELFGIPELTENWKLPFNSNYQKNETLAFVLKSIISVNEQYIKELNILFDFYVKLNPKISKIPYKDWFDKYMIILGITSSYNYDDIYSFIVDGGFYKRSNEYKELYSKIINILGLISLSYVPSEKSLKLILSHISKR